MKNILKLGTLIGTFMFFVLANKASLETTDKVVKLDTQAEAYVMYMKGVEAGRQAYLYENYEVVKKITYDADGKELIVENFSYDDGLLTKKEVVDDKGTKSYSYFYNDDDKLIEIKGSTNLSYEYDEDGNLIKEISDNGTGLYYYYDNLKVVRYYDNEGNYLGRTKEYLDDNGNVVMVRQINANEETIVETRNAFDEKDRIIKVYETIDGKEELAGQYIY